MNHKLGICIPYRDREEHLKKLVPHLSKYLTEKGIDHHFYVAHQVDEKLFNRCSMKNIAAQQALNDGCDYVAFHDVDMLVIDADYSYPDDKPIHISTKLSKYNYNMGYEQYFGGVVLMNKTHLEKTNGYSNDYWDWGQEDDDLLWRSHYEGLTKSEFYKYYHNVPAVYLNGNMSYLKVKTNRDISSQLTNDHTITMTFYAEQQENKYPIWLVGDPNRTFIEYPLLRKVGSNNWGLSFNNSRTVNVNYLDRNGKNYYNWAKKHEEEWTEVIVTYDSYNHKLYFYINGELIYNVNDIKESLPYHIDTDLFRHNSNGEFIIGYCPQSNINFKGYIFDFQIYDRYFENIDDVFKTESMTGIHNSEIYNCKMTYNNIMINKTILPYRREGSFDCLPHKDEGFVNGYWVKGETTARNEKRFVTEMQKGFINYKVDGLNNLKFDLVSSEEIMDKCTMLNVKL